MSNTERTQQTARSHDLKDIRTVGIGAIALIALAMALPWIVVSAPLIGSISVSGYKSGGDGWVFLGVAVLTALVAFQRYAKATGWLAVGLAVGLIGEYAYNAVSVKNEMQADASDNEFAKALADAVSVQPGFGLILGVLIAGALAAYALWYVPRTQQVATTEQPVA